MRRPFSNRWLNMAISWELIMLTLILYVPFLSDLFGTYRLPLRDWLIVVGVASTISPVLETVKFIVRRYGKSQ
jgi:Ca2+-transporting ATPase